MGGARESSALQRVETKMLSNVITVSLMYMIIPSQALKGLDASVVLYDFDFKDFVEGGSGDFVVFQAYHNDGSVNHYAVNDSEEAYAAGFTKFDVYISPCPRCNKSASQQVQEAGKSVFHA